jgi:DNA-binding MarR family transcriptional regulator
MSRTLRSEIRQRRPFQSLEQEAYLSVVRTAAALSGSFEAMLRPAGITPAQYNVLRILRGAEPAGLCRNEVRERMLTRMPDMTRLLDRMEAAGLVRRSRDTEDRRLVTTRITAQGERLLDDLEEAVAEEHRRRLGHLDAKQLRGLIEVLQRIREQT